MVVVVVVQVSFDLLEAYLREHPEASDCGVGFRENALFQDYHGLKSFRMVRLLDEQTNPGSGVLDFLLAGR